MARKKKYNPMISLQDFIANTVPAIDNIREQYQNIMVNTHHVISFENFITINNKEYKYRVTIKPKTLKLKVMFIDFDYFDWHVLKYHNKDLKENLTKLYEDWKDSYKYDLIQYF